LKEGKSFKLLEVAVMEQKAGTPRAVPERGGLATFFYVNREILWSLGKEELIFHI
jgi:hypothetical protein